jgi:hypothetical protein
MLAEPLTPGQWFDGHRHLPGRLCRRALPDQTGHEQKVNTTNTATAQTQPSTTGGITIMPNYNQCLQAIVLLAIGGFALVVLSGFWPVLVLFIISAVILWLWWPFPRR